MRGAMHKVTDRYSVWEKQIRPETWSVPIGELGWYVSHHGDYGTIQAGPFKTRERAEKRAKKLEAEDCPPSSGDAGVAPAKMKPGTKVVVGEGIGPLKAGETATVVEGPKRMQGISNVCTIENAKGHREDVHESRLKVSPSSVSSSREGEPRDAHGRWTAAGAHLTADWRDRPDELVYFDGVPRKRADVLASLKEAGLDDNAIELFMKSAEPFAH
jgi:hypothetical protein